MQRREEGSMMDWAWYEVVALVVIGLVLILVNSPRDRWYIIIPWDEDEEESL